MRFIINFVIVLAFLSFAFAIVIGYAMQERERDAACINMGGVVVRPGALQNVQCWSADGTRRLFPRVQ